jgi:hypothetical protein
MLLLPLLLLLVLGCRLRAALRSGGGSRISRCVQDIHELLHHLKALGWLRCSQLTARPDPSVAGKARPQTKR